MATRSLGTLTLDLIARTAGFTQGMDKASQSARKTGRDIETSISRSVDRAVGSLRTLAGIAGLGFSVQQVTQYADAFTGLQNRLRLVTDSQEELNRATTDLFDISLRTAQNIDSTAQVYQRFAQNAQDLGLSLKDVAELTDTVSKAVAISGASSEAASAALTQFGQALASGVLRGEELNSVMEQAPGLARAIADGLNIPIGSLRDLAKEGKITSEAIITALRRAAEGVDQQFSTRVLTLGQGFENLRTAVTEYVGRLDSAAGASNSLARAIDNIAQSISQASRDMGDIGREIDAVKELFSVLDEFAQDFLQGFRSESGDVAQYFQTSFAESFLATARELDALWDAFDGAALALQAVFETLGENIRIAFSNAFYKIREAFSELIGTIARGINDTFGTSIKHGSFAGPKPEDFKSLSDAAKEAFAEGGKTVNLYQQLLGRLNMRGLEDSFDVNLANPSGARPRGAPASGSSGDGGSGKKKLDEGEKYIQQLRERNALIGQETEYEKLLARIRSGSLQFSSQALQAQALELAKQLDLSQQQIQTEKILRDLRMQASVTQIQFMRELASFGQGDQVRALNDELARVEDRYRELIEQRRNSPLGLSDEELALIQESLNRELDMVRAHHEAKIAIQGDWELGARDALINYADEAANVYESLSQTVGSAFKGMESSLVDFVRTGKADFRSLADSIISDMIRIMVQQSITGPLASYMGGLIPFASGGYTGDGGRFEPAGIVHKGEGVLNQDEIRALGGAGGFNALRRAIRTGHAVGGMAGLPSLPPTSSGSSGSVNVTVNVSGGQSQVNAPDGWENFAKEIGDFVDAKIREREIKAQRQGGIAWQARQGAFS